MIVVPHFNSTWWLTSYRFETFGRNYASRGPKLEAENWVVKLEIQFLKYLLQAFVINELEICLNITYYFFVVANW